MKRQRTCRRCKARIDADVAIVTAARGVVCVPCAMHGQALDDERRWEDAMRRGEDARAKCGREAREFADRKERR